MDSLNPILMPIKAMDFYSLMNWLMKSIGTVYSTIIFPIYCSNKAILGSKNLKTIDDGWVKPFVYGWAHQIPTDSPIAG